MYNTVIFVGIIIIHKNETVRNDKYLISNNQLIIFN